MVARFDLPRLGPDLGDASDGVAPRVFGASFSVDGGVMAAPVRGGMTGVARVARMARWLAKLS